MNGILENTDLNSLEQLTDAERDQMLERLRAELSEPHGMPISKEMLWGVPTDED